MKPYDYIIVGSGLGGLECAYILAKEGFHVCVLEKNRQFGGNLQIFSRDKVIFDTGVHYIGGLDEGQNLYQYFKYFGIIDELKLRRMGADGFDKITFSGDEKVYPHAIGYENFINQLLPYFPKEESGLQKYVDKLAEVAKAYPLYNVDYQPLDNFDFKYLDINARSFIESCTQNIKLRNVLAGSNPLYAGTGEDTPLYVHALVINSYMDSAWKCVDGGGQIAKLLVQKIRKMGGEVRNYAEVVNFNFSIGKEATGVTLKSGEQLEAKNFIANIHPVQFVNLIKEKGRIRPAYTRRMNMLKNSISVFTVHIVFKENTFPYLNYNIYHHGNQDAWSSLDYDKKKWPEGYALFVPASSKSEEYADCMNLMAYMRFEEVEEWGNTFNTTPKNVNERNAAYQDFKTQKAELLIDKLSERFPNIRENIKSYYTSTPLSFRDYIGTSDGTMYGIQKSAADPLRTFVTPRTRIPNIFLTGQNVNLHGVLGVTLSSMVTCGQILDLKYLIKKIKKAQ